MSIENYAELDGFQMDVMRELGSIGAGNAATALSSILDRKVRIHVPQVRVLENNEAVKQLGGPEKLVTGILITFDGDIQGMILNIQSLDYINMILGAMMDRTISSFDELTEMDCSALCEIGNITMAGYINAISSMTELEINLSVPAITVNMLGGILNVPMAEFGYEANELMIINSYIEMDGNNTMCDLFMIPDIRSLNTILTKLGVIGG